MLYRVWNANKEAKVAVDDARFAAKALEGAKERPLTAKQQVRLLLFCTRNEWESTMRCE